MRADSSFPCYVKSVVNLCILNEKDIAGSSYLEELSHCTSLLFSNCGILLLDHTQPADCQLELHLYLGLKT